MSSAWTVLPSSGGLPYSPDPLSSLPVTLSCSCIPGFPGYLPLVYACICPSSFTSLQRSGVPSNTAERTLFNILQHAVTFAAGLAAEGMVPVCAIYSSFLQRGYDQIVHDVALQRLPVRFALDRAGLVGADGATHSGFADVTYMGVLPNMVIMAVRARAHSPDLQYTFDPKP